MKNSGDNVFRRCSVGLEEASLVRAYLDGHDFAANSRRAICNDLSEVRELVLRCEQGTVPSSVASPLVT